MALPTDSNGVFIAEWPTIVFTLTLGTTGKKHLTAKLIQKRKKIRHWRGRYHIGRGL